jgi:hypothetical protein
MVGWVGKSAEEIAQDAVVVVTFVQVGSLVVLEAELVIGEMEFVWADSDNRPYMSMLSMSK